MPSAERAPATHPDRRAARGWRRGLIGLAAPLAFAALAGCGDADEAPPPETPPAATGGTTAGASGDPSVPATPQAMTPGPGEGAQDSAATAPEAPMTPREESQSMPEAGQANNHSSTAMDDEKK